MPSIVPMTADRFADMDKIDVEAWSNWATKKFGRAIQFPSKALVYGTYLDGDPEGGFIALDDRGKPIGYIFTRTFGKVGFFGPFGVVPGYQGIAVGKALVRATIDYMERSGCTTIGLETMPETAYNLGLYTKLGFRLFSLTLRLQKSLESGAKNLASNVKAVSRPTDELLAQIQRISGTLEDGLDFSKEVALLGKYPIGPVWLTKRTLRSVALRCATRSMRQSAFIPQVMPKTSGCESWGWTRSAAIRKTSPLSSARARLSGAR